MSASMDRRDFLAHFAALPIVSAIGMNAKPNGRRPPMTVYKTPTCGCCKEWVKHVEKAGFKVTAKDMNSTDAVRKEMGVPAAMASCHTAIVGKYVIEGHVPADLIDKLLAQAPAARGLAIPGMPQSAPGMDMPGQKYDVLLFTTDGKTSIYASR